MNLNQEQVVMWANVPYTIATAIDALVHLGYNVNVNYTPGGIFISITRLGRGHASSGIDEAAVLSELIARMIAEDDMPATAKRHAIPAPVVEMNNARNEVEAQPQAPGALREAAKEGAVEGLGGSDLKHPKAQRKT